MAGVALGDDGEDAHRAGLVCHIVQQSFHEHRLE
jgi:hypothetical protein